MPDIGPHLITDLIASTSEYARPVYDMIQGPGFMILAIGLVGSIVYLGYQIFNSFISRY